MCIASVIDEVNRAVEDELFQVDSIIYLETASESSIHTMTKVVDRTERVYLDTNASDRWNTAWLHYNWSCLACFLGTLGFFLRFLLLIYYYDHG